MECDQNNKDRQNNRIVVTRPTQKLIFDKIEEEENRQALHFKSYLKEDFVERALVITVDESNIIRKIYFSSNKYGTTTWINGHGVYDSHRWESEDDLEQLSTLAQRYPSLLEDGFMPPEFAMEKIIPDVLDNLLDSELSSILYKIIEKKSSKKSHKWDDIVQKYRILSNEFLNNSNTSL